MIKLTGIEPRDACKLLLRFSDGAWGVFDLAAFVQAATEMTAPLADPAYFSRHFIEAGALAWPNGFELSAHSLHHRLEDAGALRRESAAA